MSKLVGSLIVFRGEDEKANKDVLIEFSDLNDGGLVELQFEYAGQNHYLKFSVVDLLRMALTEELRP